MAVYIPFATVVDGKPVISFSLYHDPTATSGDPTYSFINAVAGTERPQPEAGPRPTAQLVPEGSDETFDAYLKKCGDDEIASARRLARERLESGQAPLLFTSEESNPSERFEEAAKDGLEGLDKDIDMIFEACEELEKVNSPTSENEEPAGAQVQQDCSAPEALI